MHGPPSYRNAFTLIELSIVLVIIGLIVGGVLVGQDLIKAAEVRAQISQIEKYQTAVNTFRGKYDALPGDISAAAASQFGFAPRGQYAGEGDGNGVLEGVISNAPYNNYGIVVATGEPVMFWVDLSAAHLIDGSFSTASSTVVPGADITASNIDLYLPQAKIGRGNYLYVYSGSYFNGGYFNLGVNYFGLSAVNGILASSQDGFIGSTPTIPVAMAYCIDKKIDDGLPQSGSVMAWYLNGNQFWTDGTNASTTANEPTPNTGALAGSPSTCYDNGANASSPMQYSLAQNNGASANCALSFRFQ